MNMTTPRLPLVGNDTMPATPPVLTALAVAGRKAIRANHRKGRPAVAAIAGLIDTWSEVSPVRRRDLRTAVGILGRAAGQDLAAIVFTQQNVRRILAGTTPAACGVSEVTFKAYRGWIGHVLKRLGLMAERRGAAGAVMPAWALLLAAMVDDKGWIRLRAFIRFCSDRSIGPEAVDAALLAGYLAHLLGSGIRGTARDTVRRVAKAWNLASETVPGWPAVTLAAPAAETRQYSFDFSAYPASLQTDVTAFQERLASSDGDDLYGPDDDDDQGPCLSLRPATVKTRMDAVRMLLAAAVHSGVPIETVTSLSVLTARANAKAILDWHWKRAGSRVTDQTGVLSDTLRVIAKYHVRLPAGSMEKLLPVLRKAKPPKRKTMTDKNMRVLRQLEDPTRRAQILHLPRQMMRLAERLRAGWTDALDVEHPPRPGEAARIAGLAAAIEIELQCPIRLENLDRLQLGVHLQNNRSHGERCTHVVIPAEATKNRVPLEWTLQNDAAEVLEQYVRAFRPLLPHADTDWLFPSKVRGTSPRGKGGLSKAITREIHTLVGVRMTVHQFRAFAGALILEDNPHALEDLRLILGHTGIETAMIYYKAWAPKEAVARWNALIATKRRETKLVANAAFARSMGPLSIGGGRRQRAMRGGAS